ALLKAGALELATPSGGIAVGCRRTTIELALRRCCQAAGLPVQYATTVTGLDIGGGRVTAVHAVTGRATRTIGAGLLAAATGRNTRVSRWLPGAVTETRSGSGITTWSRFYRSSHQPQLASGVSESAAGPGWCCYGFVSDSGTCSLSLALPASSWR